MCLDQYKSICPWVKLCVVRWRNRLKLLIFWVWLTLSKQPCSMLGTAFLHFILIQKILQVFHLTLIMSLILFVSMLVLAFQIHGAYWCFTVSQVHFPSAQDTVDLCLFMKALKGTELGLWFSLAIHVYSLYGFRFLAQPLVKH